MQHRKRRYERHTILRSVGERGGVCDGAGAGHRTAGQQCDYRDLDGHADREPARRDARRPEPQRAGDPRGHGATPAAGRPAVSSSPSTRLAFCSAWPTLVATVRTSRQWASGGTWNLPRAVGLPRAKGLAMLGDKLPAEKAEAWGMIWRCVEDDELMTEAHKLATHLATQPTRGLGRIKQLLNASTARALDEELEAERDAMRELGRSADYAEGVAAFIGKRKPKFTGR